jgi:peptide/nickel transport system permease protein
MSSNVWQYLARRIVSTLLTLFGVSILVFLMLQLIPGTVVEQIMGTDAMVTKETVASLKAFFGLDQPIHIQYLHWIENVAQGNFGISWRTGKSVLGLIIDHLPVTGELTFLALMVAFLIGVPAGVFSATRTNTVLDNVTRVVSLLGLSLPVFWQGTMLILIFSLLLHWMPALDYTGFFDDPLRNLRLMAMPSICLGTASAAMIMRMTRACLLEVLGQEYVRTARAKGLGERLVIYRHALRNAMIPVITVAGVQVGYLLGGIVVVEEVFTLPGVGRLVLSAIFNRDYPLVQGAVLFIALVFMLTNLLVDLLYSVIDPRIRY